MAFTPEAQPFDATRPVSSTGIDSPPPLRHVQIVRYPRGIDIAKDTSSLLPEDQAGMRYEKQCFELLSQRLTDGEFAVGPHILDRAFGDYPYNLYARADAIRFSTLYGKLVLVELDEFKRKKRNSYSALQEKINAFPQLLDLFREDSELLPELLNQATNGHIDLGAVEVPPNSRVRVLVMSSHEHNGNGLVLPFPTEFEYVAPAA